jgi:hypothetical protein
MELDILEKEVLEEIGKYKEISPDKLHKILSRYFEDEWKRKLLIKKFKEMGILVLKRDGFFDINFEIIRETLGE